MYADGIPHVLEESCSQHCPSPTASMQRTDKQFSSKSHSNKHSNVNDLINTHSGAGQLSDNHTQLQLLKEVDELQENLEKEIINTEKFVASNEKIEERYKRSEINIDNELHLNAKARKKSKSLKFEVSVNRDNIEKMTRMKEFASGKHIGKAFVKSASDTSCAACPEFAGHNIFDIHLRLAKGLNCTGDDVPCESRPELKMTVELRKRERLCSSGTFALLPDTHNSQCVVNSTGLNSEAVLEEAQCIEPTCNNESMFTKRHARDDKLIKIRHMAMVPVDRFGKASDGSMESSNDFLVKIYPSLAASTCVFHLSTSTKKHVELTVPSELRAHITVYENSLLKPKWDIEHCSESPSKSYWLHTDADDLYILYNNPYPIENTAAITASLQQMGCPAPPAVHFAQVMKLL